jgi:predicted O-methyltransferase YrrM
MSLLAKLRFYPKSLLLRAQLAATRSLLSGSYKWQALDRLGIHGFGTDLLRVDFPPDAHASPRWQPGDPTHTRLAAILDADSSLQSEFLEQCLAFAPEIREWPAAERETQPDLPWFENLFLTRLDMTVLYGALRELRPERYLEVGSGMSTRVAAQAKRRGGFAMEIVSVDPEPRLAIAALCDRVERRRLEDAVDEFVSLATARSVVFFDGSHRCFPGSDVTVFFLEVLPRLPAGCVVHIHDIYLPDDYPRSAYNRLWSEQYLLAGWLLGGAAGVKILLPCARLSHRHETQVIVRSALGEGRMAASSFWLQKN